jgi:tetratricopeptide (TPR) repeat protein
MIVSLHRRDLYFYPVLFTAWALFLFVRYGGHHYFNTPFPSAGFERMKGGMSNHSLLRASLAELQKNLIDEKDKKEKPHILQNIGCAYYDLYKETGDRILLDSALTFIFQSTIEGPGIARFHYNFGRMFTEIGDQTRALQQYELAIKYEPLHILALSNAGTCSYFAFNQRKAAAGYFGRALAIDSLMPMCNVVLGLISIDEKDYAAARTSFENELAADAAAALRNRYPLSLDNINYAALLSHQNLMTLYCSKFPDAHRARRHLDAALTLEPDPMKREMMIKEFERYEGRKITGIQ